MYIEDTNEVKCAHRAKKMHDNTLERLHTNYDSLPSELVVRDTVVNINDVPLYHDDFEFLEQWGASLTASTIVAYLCHINNNKVSISSIVFYLLVCYCFCLRVDDISKTTRTQICV